MREWRIFYIVRHSTADHRFEVRQRMDDGHKSLHARTAFAPGDVLVRFSARATLAEPAVHTVQLNESEHILLEPEFLEYTNHSCSPNVIFDLDEMVVIAIEAIHPGGEIVYFYPSTESSMSQPFVCNCESDNCLGIIQGADYLPVDVLERYHLAGHIQSLLLLRQLAS
jgi:SET domain